MDMSMFNNMAKTSREDPAKAEATAKMLSNMISTMEKAKTDPLGAMKDLMSGPNAPSKEEMEAIMKMAGQAGLGGEGILGKAKMMGEMFKKLGK